MDQRRAKSHVVVSRDNGVVKLASGKYVGSHEERWMSRSGDQIWKWGEASDFGAELRICVRSGCWRLRFA